VGPFLRAVRPDGPFFVDSDDSVSQDFCLTISVREADYPEAKRLVSEYNQALEDTEKNGSA
jgi:hypothetical protein